MAGPGQWRRGPHALFGTRASLDRLAAYVDAAAPYDNIRLTIFPHGVDSINLPTMSEWQEVLSRARRHSELAGVGQRHYPRHSRTIAGFHTDMSRLPQVPPGPPLLDWDTARRYLADHAAANRVTFDEARAKSSCGSRGG